MDAAVRDYVEAIPAENRPLFDRLHRIILAEHPGAQVTISYDLPTYTVGKRRLYLGSWQHGVSLYGWGADRDGGFLARHPELKSGKGTIKLRPEAAAEIDDSEFRDLVRAALSP
ncbi:DUF1801 domain-containing protein [Hamadaea sp. NPDC051192]|uniref:iron chaperone n=1 Tax=Hamadaea sp. NPDC051192 TaxID=3154940 RepID=UPI0034281B24